MDIGQIKDKLFELFRGSGGNTEGVGTSVYHGGERSENSYSRFGKKREVEKDGISELMKEDNECNFSMFNKYDLSLKVKNYLDWYRDNILIHYVGKEKDVEIEKLKNFIEKMAVWYELRYPDYEIDKLMNIENIEDIDVNSVMFYDNPVMKDMMKKVKFLWRDDYNKLKWEDFYSTKAFVHSLAYDEWLYLARVKYPEKVTFQFNVNDMFFKSFGVVTLSSKGIIQEVNYVLRNYVGDSVIGMKIQDFLEYLKNKGIIVDRELENAISDYENKKYSKEELLNCVMYRIIERGGEQYGPRRGYLFAKEFDRNKDIPMMYGTSPYVDGEREFYQMYLKDGGDIELKCLDNYFSGSSITREMISIKDILAREIYYTNDEVALFQRLLNTLVYRREVVSLEEGQAIDIEKQEREEIQAKRLQRKLDKARNFKGSN